MAPPKKKDVQRMSLGDFLSDQTLGKTTSWADEVDEFAASGSQPLPPTDRPQNAWVSTDRNYPVRDSGPQKMPDRPPYTAHLGNLSYDATVDSVMEFFSGCSIINVRIIEDREQQRPKGFAYAEFENADGLKKALSKDGTPFEGRSIKVKIAEPPRERDGRGDVNRDLNDWTRKGPLPEIASRSNRAPADFGDRRPSRDVVDDGRVRDFNNWERKGPLSSGPGMERQMSRDDSRPRMNDLPRNDSFRSRKQSPAPWAEARQEGSRPPRRDIPTERPDRQDRLSGAADNNMQWRTSMRPDAPSKSPSLSREGSEAPPSPAGPPGASSPSAGPPSRPKLNLQKRTVSEAVELVSPAGTESKVNNPFGSARPIDTAAKEREIKEKNLIAAKEKREAEEKAKDDRRLAKEAAAKAAAAKAAAVAAEAAAAAIAATTAAAAAAAEAARKAEEARLNEQKQKTANEPKVEAGKTPNIEAGVETEHEVGPEAQTPGVPDTKLLVDSNEAKETKEAMKELKESKDKDSQNAKSRATESGNWRQPSGEQKAARSTPPGGPRRGGARGGSRHDSPRPTRANGSPAQQQVDQDGKSPDEEGWTTVPNKRRSQGRIVAS